MDYARKHPNGFSAPNWLTGFTNSLAGAADKMAASHYIAVLRLGPAGSPPTLCIAGGDSALADERYAANLAHDRYTSFIDYRCAGGLFAVRIHKHAERCFALGMTWSGAALPKEPRARQSVYSDLLMCCLDAEPAAYRLAQQQRTMRPGTLLTDHHRVLLQWLAKGIPNHLTAQLMNLSPQEYEKLQADAISAIGAASVAEAAVIATDRRLI